MNEDAYLEDILALAEAEGYAAAYDKLFKALPGFPAPSPQVLYFLACLAGGAGKDAEALRWLAEAIEHKGYWYRPEVLEDGDLESLFENPEFLRLKALSAERCRLAQKEAVPRFTWKEKAADTLLIALHGNSQCTETALSDWAALGANGVQLEAVQSHIVDSYGRYRWNYDGENYRDLSAAVESVADEGYDQLVLAGFSAGCDMILRSVLFAGVKPNLILLQSPWIPITDTKLDDVAAAVQKTGAEVRIFCGELDEDCCPMAERLFYALGSAFVNASFYRQRGLHHQFPAQLGSEYRI